MIIYHFSEENGEYVGESEAKISPLDRRNGKTFYLIPKNATPNPPPIISSSDSGGKKIRWDGKKWEIFIPRKIIIQTAKKIIIKQLLEEIIAEFKNDNVLITGDTLKEGEKTIYIEGIECTQENKNKITMVLEQHDYTKTTADLEKMKKIELASFRVLVREIRKIAPSFPTINEFKQLVKDEFLSM